MWNETGFPKNRAIRLVRDMGVLGGTAVAGGGLMLVSAQGLLQLSNISTACISLFALLSPSPALPSKAANSSVQGLSFIIQFLELVRLTRCQ